MFNLLDLYLIISLNYDKYYDTLTNLKFNLLVDKEKRLIYIEMSTVAE